MVRSHKGFVSELECVQHRSSIIRKVLQAKKTYCPSISTAESFIHPKCLQYPLPCISEMALFSLPIVTQAIINSEPFAVSNDGKMYNVEKLVLFEPYSHIGETNLQTIFDPENKQKTIEDSILKSIAYSITECTEDPQALKLKKQMFVEAFKVMCHSDNELLEIFQAWNSHSTGTYQCLREKLDDISLFCGRNILVSRYIYVNSLYIIHIT